MEGKGENKGDKVFKGFKEVKRGEPLIVCIDFDGTIARSDYPVIKGEMPYAREVIKRMKDRGCYVIIWTCRTGEELLDAINWLVERDIPFDRVNDHNPGNLREFGGKGGKKVYADVYIDDKNVGGFPGWLEVERVLGEGGIV